MSDAKNLSSNKSDNLKRKNNKNKVVNKEGQHKEIQHLILKHIRTCAKDTKFSMNDDENKME